MTLIKNLWICRKVKELLLKYPLTFFGASLVVISIVACSSPASSLVGPIMKRTGSYCKTIVEISYIHPLTFQNTAEFKELVSKCNEEINNNGKLRN